MLIPLNRINYARPFTTKDDLGRALGKWQEFETKFNDDYDPTKPFFCVLMGDQFVIDLDPITSQKLKKADEDYRHKCETNPDAAHKYHLLQLNYRLLISKNHQFDYLKDLTEFLTEFDLPNDTYIVQTQSGGFHLYYRLQGPPLMNSAIQRIWKEFAIDSRAAGGLLYGEGTTLQNGHTYRRLQGDPEELAQIPTWQAAWVVGRMSQRASGVEIGQFLAGQVDPHGFDRNRINREFVLWKEALFALKELGYSQDDVLEVFKGCQGFDMGRSRSQIKAWWEKEEDPKRAKAQTTSSKAKKKTKSDKDDDMDWDIEFLEDWADMYGEEYLWIEEFQTSNSKMEYFFHYEHGVYTKITGVEVRGICRDYLIAKGIKRSTNKLNMMRQMIQETYRCHLSDFDADPNLLNLQNGLFDLRTLTLLPHTMDYRSLLQIELEFHPQPQETPGIDRIREAYPDTFFQVERYVQSIIHKDYSHEQMLNLLGPTGSGKGTTLNLIDKAFGKVCMKGELYSLGGTHGLSALIDHCIFMDPDMSISSLDNKTIGVVKKITGGDTASGVQVNIKNIPQFKSPISAFLITATNQFRELPEDVEIDAWFRRTNIAVFDKVFPSDPLKNQVLEEVNDWISELILIPYHNWTLGLDKHKDWIPRQKKLWEDSSRVYRQITQLHFEYSYNDKLYSSDVVAFFRRILVKRGMNVPSETRLLQIITTEFTALNVVKRTSGRNRIGYYLHVRPINQQVYEEYTSADPFLDEDEWDMLEQHRREEDRPWGKK